MTALPVVTSATGVAGLPEDLRRVLAELVRGARTALAANFSGAYVVGSFALGAGDENSDVDFVIATRAAMTIEQVLMIRALHARLPDLPVGWAGHLEGSYAPEAELRGGAGRRQRWWYVDNGSRELERSIHDNTAVLRWILREHGIVLAGPEPAALLDAVTADELRQEVPVTLAAWDGELKDHPVLLSTDRAWQQHVLGLCRVLCTLSVGRVVSKAAAGAWALQALDRTWRTLVQRALADRADQWERVHRAADPALVQRTWKFHDYALSWARLPGRRSHSAQGARRG